MFDKYQLRFHHQKCFILLFAVLQVKNVGKVKKVKNVTEDGLGTKHGRVHVPAQNIGSELQTRKLKAFKETPEEKKLAKLKKIKEKQVCSLIPFLILVDVLEVENDWSAK